MNKTHKKTIIFIILVLLIMIYYVRSIPQVTLTERAIVLGLGIDVVDDKYEVTVEFVKAKSSGAENSSNDGYVLSSSVGKTLSEVFDLIAHKTGLTISLSQCNVIVLGEDIMNEGIVPKLQYIVKAYSVPEQTTLLVAKESAKKLLETKPIVSDNSALQIINAMHYSSDSEEIITTSIKDFYEGLESLSKMCSVAYILKNPVNSDDVGGEDNSDDEYFEYDYSKCVLFTKDGDCIYCDNDVVSAINLVLNTVKKGSEEIEFSGVSYGLSIEKKKYKDDIELVDGNIKYLGELNIEYSLKDYEEISAGGVNISDVEDALENNIKERIIKTFEMCRSKNIDVFHLADKCYASLGKKWAEFENNYLDKISLNISTNITIVKS